MRRRNIYIEREWMPHVAVIIFVCLVRGKLSGDEFVSVDVGGFTSAVRQSRIYVKFCRKRFVKGDEGCI